jgi:hypothetical protein
MGRVIAIDPGRATGWAAFVDGQVREAGVFDGDKGVPFQLARWASSSLAAEGGGTPLQVVAERPHQGKGRASTGDLVTLAVRLGCILGQLGLQLRTVEIVEPAQWKGSVDKKIHQPRILAALLAPERALLGDALKDHNAVDAIGLGLWKVGRMTRGGGGV